MSILQFGEIEALRLIGEITRGLTARELSVLACCLVFCARRFLAD